MSTDSATAYDHYALEFLRARDRQQIGKGVAERWAQSLDPGADVLELACGAGDPITRTLVDCGLNVQAVDSSPTLVKRFAERFPGVPVFLDRVQTFDFQQRAFDAVIAVGLVFLLPEAEQLQLFSGVSTALRDGGRFLFSAPVEPGTWDDRVTRHGCLSLGRTRYEAALREAGFRLSARYEDEGRNHYYDAVRLVRPDA
jgi:SAM-dependent methyltransferase